MKTVYLLSTDRNQKDVYRVWDVKEISANNELSTCTYRAEKVKDNSDSIKNDSQELETG